MEADEERIKLEKLAEELALQEDDDAQDYLQEVSILRQKKVGNSVGQNLF